MALVFLSYSRKDSDFTSKLRDDLVGRAIPVWRDQEDIHRGTNWDTTVSNVLNGGEITHFLVALSESSVISENVLDEISLAVDNQVKYIIPLILDNCKRPLRISRRSYVDFRAGYDEALQELIAELDRIAEPPKPKRRLSVVLTEPQKNPTKEQIDAAHDARPQVRLIAGPGTGKSFAIEERVSWLLAKGEDPNSIYVTSFTRASSRDLQTRVSRYCERKGQNNVWDVSITTLHSLVLTVLRKAKLLSSYPVDPQVLDEWELDNVFDEELSESLSSNGVKCTPTRLSEIRRAYEAFWSTGQENPPNYIRPKTPITESERNAFIALYNPTTRVYSCVLPGEIILKCVERMNSGLLDPVQLLGVKHLIVDEFQDLNNTDLSFVDALIRGGVNTFVAGDDDQSVYSFRFAYPSGIQDFQKTYPDAAHHELTECFRCSPSVLQSAQNLISQYQGPNRIAKNLKSRYLTTTPPVDGAIHHWLFKSEQQEAKAIVQSAQKLIERGIKEREILVLISSRRSQLPPLRKAFENSGINIELPDGLRYIDTAHGRYAYAVVRIACDLNLQDYYAHRLVFGLPKGVSAALCGFIRDKVLKYNLNYLDLFYNPIPPDIFTRPELRAIERARKLCENIRSWRSADTIDQRKDEVLQLLRGAFNDEGEGALWLEYIARLPSEMTLSELRSYMGANTDEQVATLMKEVYARLEMEIPENGFLPPKVRVMTMHGAKGLDAQVVFVPGLEENILPGLKRKTYQGLVLEAARLLYVSITRARAACVMSFSTSRQTSGQREYGRLASDFNGHLEGVFVLRDHGVTDSEADQISQIVEDIRSVG